MNAVNAAGGDRDIELQEARVAAAARETGRPWSEGWEPDARQVEDDQSYWLLTMVDLMTLLLTLFVLLAAYAYQQKAEHPIAPGSGAQVDQPANTPRSTGSDSGGLMEPPEAATGDDRPNPDTQAAQGTNLIGEDNNVLLRESRDTNVRQTASTVEKARPGEQARALADRFEGMGDSVEVSTIAGHVQLRVKDNILFPTAEASLSASGAALLRELAARLADSDYRITVEGHTDNRPIDTWRYPSNWELSAARAAAVVRQLIDAGIHPQRLHAVGLADTQPITENDSVAGRAENRRVDLVLELPARKERAP